MAIRCKFTDVERQTARSKRRDGISALANSKYAIDSDYVKKRARHKTDLSHKEYKAYADQNFDAAQQTFHDQRFDKPLVSLYCFIIIYYFKELMISIVFVLLFTLLGYDS